jgi:hypothetical protein
VHHRDAYARKSLSPAICAIKQTYTNYGVPCNFNVDSEFTPLDCSIQAANDESEIVYEKVTL